MSKVKSLFASMQDNPVLMRRFNGWMTVVWMVMLPISILTGLVNSVGFISLISIYALVTGHLSSWQAARVEVKQEEEAEKKDDDFEEKVEVKLDKIEKQT